MIPMTRRGGLFGAPMRYETPPFVGDNGASPDAAPITRMAATPTPAGFMPRKRSILDKVGLLADAFQGSNHNAQALAAQDEQDRDLWLAQQRPQQDFANWQRRYDYEVANPKPSTAQPYRWESNDGDVYELGADGQPKRVFDDPTPRMQFIPDGMGGGQYVALPGTGAAQPPAPVGTLKPVGKLKPIGGAGLGPQTFR